MNERITKITFNAFYQPTEFECPGWGTEAIYVVGNVTENGLIQTLRDHVATNSRITKISDMSFGVVKEIPSGYPSVYGADGGAVKPKRPHPVAPLVAEFA